MDLKSALFLFLNTCLYGNASNVELKPYRFISGQKFACVFNIIFVDVDVSQIERYGLQGHVNLSAYPIKMIDVSGQTQICVTTSLVC